MATYSNLNSLFKDIANSIRSKTGSTAAIVANNFPTAINAISTGTNTADANAVAADILSPKTAYVNGSKLTGTIATKTASNLSASGATVTAEAGYYASAVSKAVASGSATTPATTVYTGKVGMSFNASNGVVTASSVSGTASVTPTVSAGYVSAGTAGTITATSNANTYSVGLASINAPSGSAKQSKPGLAFNASNGVVTATVAATSGTAYANVATAGYIAAGAKSGTFTMSAADSNTISVGLASINAPSGSKQQSTPAVTLYANGLVSATSAATSGTAYANVATAGYIAAGAKSGTFSLTASAAGTKQLTTQAGGTTTITGNTKIVANQTFTTGDVYATVDTGAIRYAQASFSGPKVGMSVANATGIVTASSATSNSLFNYANIYKAGYLTAGNRSITGSFTSTGNTLQLNTKAGGTTNISGNTKIINAGQFAIGDIYANPAPIGSINRILIEPYRVVLLSDQYPAVNKSTNPSTVFSSGYCDITLGSDQTSATIYTYAKTYYQILQNHDWWAIYDNGAKVKLNDVASQGNVVECQCYFSYSGLSSYNYWWFNGTAGRPNATARDIMYLPENKTTASVYDASGNTGTQIGCFSYISTNGKGASGSTTISINYVKINGLTYPLSIPRGYTYASSVANPQMLSKRYGSNMVLSAGRAYYRVNAGDTVVGLVGVGNTSDYIDTGYVYPLFLSTTSSAVEHYDGNNSTHRTYVTSITYNGTTWYCGDVINPGTSTSSTTHYLGYNLTNPYGSSVSSVSNAIPLKGVGFVRLYDGSSYKIADIQKAAKRILDYYYNG